MIDLDREAFEKLPEVASILKGNDCRFLGDGYRVYGDNELQCYLDGAWYAYQEQQKKLDCCREENKAHLEKIDELQARVDEALNMLCKLQYSSGERIYGEVGGILKGNKDV